MIDYLVEYWYLGIVVLILSWEIVKWILKKVIRLIFAPVRIATKLLFGNQKLLTIELLVVLLIAIGIIIYLVVFRL